MTDEFDPEYHRITTAWHIDLDLWPLLSIPVIQLGHLLVLKGNVDQTKPWLLLAQCTSSPGRCSNVCADSIPVGIVALRHFKRITSQSISHSISFCRSSILVLDVILGWQTSSTQCTTAVLLLEILILTFDLWGHLLSANLAATLVWRIMFIQLTFDFNSINVLSLS